MNTIKNTSLTEKALAERWAISVKTLQAWRQQGKGPRFLKLGRAVRYPIDGIVAHEADVTLASTSSEVTQ